MSTIQVNCVDQVMTFTNMPVVASGDVNADKIRFTFCDLWDGYTGRTCTFYQQRGVYYYALLDQNNEVDIPAAMLSQPGLIRFGVSGYKDGVTKTTSVLCYEIVEGAYTEAVDPEAGQDLIQVIQGNVAEMRDAYDDVVDSLAHLRIEGDNAFEYDEDATNQIMAALPTCVRLAQGSYTGSGTYGADNPNSITFPFVPSFVYIYDADNYFFPSANDTNTDVLIWATGQTRWAYSQGGSDKADTTFSLDGKTLSWSDSQTATSQCNSKNVKYYYIAFGLWGEVNGQ